MRDPSEAATTSAVPSPRPPEPDPSTPDPGPASDVEAVRSADAAPGAGVAAEPVRGAEPSGPPAADPAAPAPGLPETRPATLSLHASELPPESAGGPTPPPTMPAGAPPAVLPAGALPVVPPGVGGPQGWGGVAVPGAPGAPGWTMPEGVGASGGRRRARWFVLLAAALAVLVGVVGVLRFVDRDGGAPTVRRAVPLAGASVAATPYDLAVAALTGQSAALLRGDEGGWLAAVDPAKAGLRDRYRLMFRSLRGLGVSRFEYQPGAGQKVSGDAAGVSFRVDVAYCFGAEMCPGGPVTDWEKPPQISQKLTFRLAAGRYVISSLGVSAEPDDRQPTPWENGQLVFAQGRRVVLAADPAQRKDLARVLPVAEAAAAVDDRYADLINAIKPKYRIYLAGEHQWKTWYGGDDDAWAIGLALPLNRQGIDVMLRMKYMDDPQVLRVTLQHELGHVITLSGAYRADAAEDTWLSEGIAEYIGWQPRHAAQSRRLSSVRWALTGSHPPTSMIPARPGPDASDRAGDAFYGLSHFAADCMAHRYGEKKLFAFVHLVLSEDNSYDQAAHDAYGVGFAAVDAACVRWIRQQAL